MTRIRYKSERSDTDMFLVSVQEFGGIDGAYKVHLAVADAKFYITNAKGDTITEGSGVNLNVLKANAKKALVSLGVSFTVDKRVHV